MFFIYFDWQKCIGLLIILVLKGLSYSLTLGTIIEFIDRLIPLSSVQYFELIVLIIKGVLLIILN